LEQALPSFDEQQAALVLESHVAQSFLAGQQHDAKNIELVTRRRVTIRIIEKETVWNAVVILR